MTAITSSCRLDGLSSLPIGGNFRSRVMRANKILPPRARSRRAVARRSGRQLFPLGTFPVDNSPLWHTAAVSG